MKSRDEAPTSFSLLAVPVYFQSGVSRTTFEAIQRDCDKYRGRANKPDDAEVPETAGCVDLDALLEQDMLWNQTGNADEVTKVVLNVKRSLVNVVGHYVLISEKGYLDLVRARIVRCRRRSPRRRLLLGKFMRTSERLGSWS